MPKTPAELTPPQYTAVLRLVLLALDEDPSPVTEALLIRRVLAYAASIPAIDRALVRRVIRTPVGELLAQESARDP